MISAILAQPAAKRASEAEAEELNGLIEAYLAQVGGTTARE